MDCCSVCCRFVLLMLIIFCLDMGIFCQLIFVLYGGGILCFNLVVDNFVYCVGRQQVFKYCYCVGDQGDWIVQFWFIVGKSMVYFFYYCFWFEGKVGGDVWIFYGFIVLCLVDVIGKVGVDWVWFNQVDLNIVVVQFYVQCVGLCFEGIFIGGIGFVVGIGDKFYY